MFKSKFVLAALVAFAFSAFAHASVIDVPVEAKFQLSQGPIDLGVQPDKGNSFELVAAHSEPSLQIGYSETMKPNRMTYIALSLTSEDIPLTLVNEVGWRRSYNL